VGIAGGSGSGKTSLARALLAELDPARAALLTHDAYYTIAARWLHRPGRGQLRTCPTPSISRCSWSTWRRYAVGSRYVHRRIAFPPTGARATRRRWRRDHRRHRGHPAAVGARVRAALDLSIYLDAPERVRLERRLARDVAERGRTTDAVLASSRRRCATAHATYVEPTRAMADLVLSTTGRIEPIAEIAVAVVLDRFARRGGDRVRIAS
jgi:uridine kinase